MSTDRLDPAPAPGEHYNPGPPSTPRQAASVIVLRDRKLQMELLLVKRTPKARFMGGVWVFPGGAVDREEGDDDGAHRAAAVRELQEEASITVEAGRLVKFSRWITPAIVKIRYDTHFFLAEMPTGQQPAVDGEECVDFGWFSPQAALEAHVRSEIDLVFPTIKHLEQLSSFSSASELLGYAGGREVLAVEPRVVVEGEVARVLLPGEEGYNSAG